MKLTTIASAASFFALFATAAVVFGSLGIGIACTVNGEWYTTTSCIELNQVVTAAAVKGDVALNVLKAAVR